MSVTTTLCFAVEHVDNRSLDLAVIMPLFMTECNFYQLVIHTRQIQHSLCSANHEARQQFLERIGGFIDRFDAPYV
jgi:hypothetical protein